MISLSDHIRGVCLLCCFKGILRSPLFFEYEIIYWEAGFQKVEAVIKNLSK